MTTRTDRPSSHRTRGGRLVAGVLVALALAGCSRGEGPAGLNSAETIAEAFGCTGLEQVSTLPHTPDEYSCTSAEQPVMIFRADAGSVDAVTSYVRESTEHQVAHVSDDWYVTCADEPTCTAIEQDLDVTFE